MYKSKEQINKEFDEKFNHPIHEDSLKVIKIANLPIWKDLKWDFSDIKSHIAQIRQNDLKEQIKLAEGMKKEELPITHNIGKDIIGLSNSSYNESLTDFITKVESLNQDTK